jgi:hypothetical protein
MSENIISSELDTDESEEDMEFEPAEQGQEQPKAASTTTPDDLRMEAVEVCEEWAQLLETMSADGGTTESLAAQHYRVSQILALLVNPV